MIFAAKFDSQNQNLLSFASFIAKFNINYNSKTEKDSWFAVFVENQQKIAKLNQDSNGRTTFKCNIFCDKTEKEID